MPGSDESDEVVLIVREIGGVDHVSRGAFEGQVVQTQAEDAEAKVMDKGFVVDGAGEDPEHGEQSHQGDQGKDGDGLAGERRHDRQDRRDGRLA